jgi:hypothetical protein
VPGPLLGAGIGAGFGLAKSIFGGGPSPLEKARTDTELQMYQAAQDAANGVLSSPYYGGARDFYGTGLRAGAFGLGALTGDMGALGKIVNPYVQSLTNAFNKQYDYAGNQAAQQVSQAATTAGAFGGSRAALAQGQAAAGIARDRANAIGQLQYQAQNDALQRAMYLAQMGGQYASAYAGLDPATMKANILRSSLFSPTQETQGNVFSNVLGGALAGSSLLKKGQ